MSYQGIYIHHNVFLNGYTRIVYLYIYMYIYVYVPVYRHENTGIYIVYMRVRITGVGFRVRRPAETSAIAAPSARCPGYAIASVGGVCEAF